LDAKLTDLGGGEESDAGMAPDMEIYSLKTYPQVQPRRISRRIPSDMTRLIAYVINQDNAYAGTFKSLKLDKEVCTTMPRQAIFRGGTEDYTFGISLYGCPVISGNSGSPAFVPGNMDDVQVVINSALMLSRRTALRDPFAGLFDSDPPSLSKDFGMGNRIQCIHIQGQPSPDRTCERVYRKDMVVQPFQEKALKLAQDAMAKLAGDPLVEWGVTVAEAKVSRGGYSSGKQLNGVGIIPVPLCARQSVVKEDLRPRDVEYYQLALEETGDVAAKVKNRGTVGGSLISVGGRLMVSFINVQPQNVDFDSAGFSFKTPGLESPDSLLKRVTVPLSLCNGDERAQNLRKVEASVKAMFKP
jgi:hypothetical protein